MEYRTEHDSLGEVKVPQSALWGAQTQRSFQNFKIGTEKMPKRIIRALACLKQAAAETNARLGLLEPEAAEQIAQVCRGIKAGDYDDQFPLAVWQTGSGTQTNMNVNEVIAHIVNRNGALTRPLHPNDDINKGQSSNDTFPTALHIAAASAVFHDVMPALEALKGTFRELSDRYAGIVKIGRTHLQDATPLTLGQEISGWASMLEHDQKMLKDALPYLEELAIGGTAVGTGLNTHPEFGRMAAERIAEMTGLPFVSEENKFHALTSRDGVLFAHGALAALAADLIKIANDVRWLASGPRCGIGEIRIPENEPGSSIMPGKVNPTQCEAVTMVGAQVLGNQTTIAFAASQGNFELNVFLPVIAYNFLQSAELLADAMNSFNKNCARGITPNETKIRENLERSLMLVTALNPHIGYEASAKIARSAHQAGTTLREEAIRSGLVTAEEYDRWVVPENMVNTRN